jgi:hypothetical protein
MSFWTPPSIPWREFLPPTNLPDISLKQKQGFPDYKYQLDQIYNASNSLAVDVVKWYKGDTVKRKDKAKQYLQWRQNFLAFYKSLTPSTATDILFEAVVPTNEIMDSINAYKDELKEYIKVFKDAGANLRPLVVPDETREKEADEPSPFWRFVKIAGYTALGISAVYAGTEFIKAWKDGGTDE